MEQSLRATWLWQKPGTLGSNLRADVSNSLGGAGWGLVLVAFLAVGREGIETALFLWAAVQATGSTSLPLAGASLGIVVAVALGYFIYRGVLRINLSRFFGWTGVLLIIVAGGVLSYGIHDLQEAGVLPGPYNLAFDVSATIPPSSWYGALLRGTVNFSPATTWLEAIVWIGYVVPTLVIFIRAIRRGTPPAPAVAVTKPAAAPFTLAGQGA